MFVQSFVSSNMNENTYLIYDDQFTLFIDPSYHIDELIAFIKEHQLKPKAILLTHAHADHIVSVEKLRDIYAIPLYVANKEASWLTIPEYNLSPFIFGKSLTTSPANYALLGHETLQIGPFTIQVLATPGHTHGSLSYYIDQHIFTGDTLFYQTYGRYDFPTGDFQTLKQSIQQLFQLPNETIVHPGHGPQTTIKAEKQHNAILNV